MIRYRLFALAAAGAALLGSTTAHALAPWIPLTQQTADSLKYGGSINHSNGTGHTYLGTTMQQCINMMNQSKQQHLSHTHPACSITTFTEVACQKRGFFELSVPSGGGVDGVTTISVSLPNEAVRAFGDLRERFRIDAYEAEIRKLGDD